MFLDLLCCPSCFPMYFSLQPVSQLPKMGALFALSSVELWKRGRYLCKCGGGGGSTGLSPQCLRDEGRGMLTRWFRVSRLLLTGEGMYFAKLHHHTLCGEVLERAGNTTLGTQWLCSLFCSLPSTSRRQGLIQMQIQPTGLCPYLTGYFFIVRYFPDD